MQAFSCVLKVFIQKRKFIKAKICSGSYVSCFTDTNYNNKFILPCMSYFV